MIYIIMSDLFGYFFWLEYTQNLNLSCALCHNILYSSNSSCRHWFIDSLLNKKKRKKKQQLISTPAHQFKITAVEMIANDLPVLILLISSMMVHNFTNFVMKHKMKKIFPTFESLHSIDTDIQYTVVSAFRLEFFFKLYFCFNAE